ncbi:P-loop containing nucleoside triphosphate hydrolase protein [Infundibulicybe gibba]|nr:P-loop containing nucleoside triphosphate hydrolase protein [Infundibulicybe gibba]
MMSSPRVTRSTVLGKRAHQQQDPPSSSATASKTSDQLQTPDPTPNAKRVRTSISTTDGEGNKENIPPYNTEPINVDISTLPARSVSRTLRRTATELISPSQIRSLRRHASMSALHPATPTTEVSYLAIATPPPTPPTSLVPIYARARALLRPTCNTFNGEIAGRDDERAMIQTFIASFLADTSLDDSYPCSLFISGSPGTGKTALVNSVIQPSDVEASGAKVLFINCMALKSVDILWERMCEELEPYQKRKLAGKSKRAIGRDAIEALLSGLKTKCILILDELDHITSTPQSLSAVFSLPLTRSSNMRLIGIANTHTLTASSNSLTCDASSRVKTIHFAPYTPPQLVQILQSRLGSLQESDPESASQAKSFLPAPSISLLTKKIAALTGDVRSLFEVLRGAIDLAVSSTATPAVEHSEENPLHTPPITVTPTHILSALKAYTPSGPKAVSSASTTPARSSTGNGEIVSKVRNLGLQARLVLVSMLLASRRLEAGQGLSLSTSSTSTPKKGPRTPIKRTSSLTSPTVISVDITQLHAYYTAILTRGEAGVFEPVSRSEFADLIGVLDGVGLVSLSSSLLSPTPVNTTPKKAKRAFGRTASFGVGLGTKSASAGEVRLAQGVWGEEVLRGLEISDDTSNVSDDVKNEEIRNIWTKELSRLARDIKFSTAPAQTLSEVFEGAVEA